jgi:serralysin
LADGETKLVLTGTASINGTGNALDNDIAGNSGANTLLGLSGNDTLKGGLGNDVLDGGAGIDTADYSDKTLSVTANLRSPANAFVRVGNVSEDRLTDIENLIGGSGDDALTGNGLVNVLIGGLGDDTLDGSGGADSLVGGAGNDTFVVDQTGDVVVELSGQGADQIRTSLTQIDLDDYDHVENLTYTGRSTSTLIGSDADNVIQGGARTDVIQGGLGSDTLYGGDGADVLMGSADDMAGSSSDRDRLLGGRGNDVYLLNGETDAGVQIIEYRGEGTDTVLGDLARYVMADHVENYVNDRAISQNGIFQFIEITGNSQNNIIRSAPNWDLIPKTAGLDWIATNIKRLMDSTSNFVSNERFFGMAGNDTLLGGAGDDYLSGGSGRDQLTGGSGSDQFVFDAALNRTGNVDIITDFARGQDSE